MNDMTSTVLPDALAQRLANPVEPGSELSVPQLMELLLQKMEADHQLRYEEADHIADIDRALSDLLDSARPDEIGAHAAFNAMRTWYMAKLDAMQTDWREFGRYEAADSNERGPECFRV